uniref:MADS-box domain-containing protein n=1 Tax=Leersia perrieri TaxID=77586 RepID=A0A0D9VEU6_9ORYZ
MARKRVKLQRILNDAHRRATFKKRLKGLTKKASELATLCGVDMCFMVYGEGAVEVTEVWPSVPEATSVLERFKAMPDLERYKKTTNLEGFLKESINKLQKELHKVKSEADKSETKLLLVEALDGRHLTFERLTVEQLTSLARMVDARLKIVNNRLEELRGQGLLLAPTPLLAKGPLPHDTVDYTNVEKPPSQ